MKLFAKSDYRSQRFSCRAGDVVEVSDELGAWLLNDSPGTFKEDLADVEAPVQEKAMDAPPADKAVKRAPRKK